MKRNAFFRIFLRWFGQFWSSLLDEFSLNDLNFTATSLVATILRFTKLFCVILVSYALLRFTLLHTLFESKAVLESINQAHEERWFETIFLALLLTILVTSIIRIFRPIRFSATASWICLIGFLFYVVEKYRLGTFEFLSSDIINQDYLMILALPPLTELVLRVTYSFLRKKLRNRSIFLENQPIEKDNEDKTTRSGATALIARQLNRSYFEHSYSIGVVGDWGVGKTSFFKNLKPKIENAIIIHFNPWLSTGRNSLLQEFIESLKDELVSYDKTLEFDLDKYLNSLTELESQTKTSFTKVIQDLTTTKHSSGAEFLQVQKAIKRLGKKVVIIIDDLDRLTKEEIFDVLKLIRNTGDFPNTVYISCYDKIYLLHALQHFSKRNLNILLDKFFDLEVPLSPFPPKLLNDYLYFNFFSPYSIAPYSLRKETSDLILKEIGDHTFLQLREIKKFSSSLTLDYLLYGRTLHFHDFFILQVLKVKYPFIPELLWKGRERFFYLEGFPEIMKFSKNDDKPNIEIESYLKSNEEDEFTRAFLSQEDRDLIIRLLHLLFPEKTLGNPYAIQEPSFFMNYFYHSIPDTTVQITNWFKVIQDEAYFESEFFKEPHDVKKESLILDALYVDGKRFIEIFQGQPQLIFKFLFFLVDWSQGKIALLPFVNAFSLLKIDDKFSTFSRHLKGEKLTLTQISARTNFIATILRSYFYEPTFSLQFANVDQLKADNLKLFTEYAENSKEITNETISVLYNQVVSISEEKRVILNADSIKRFKQLIVEYPVSFLDLVIRAAIQPNFSLEYTFAPYTISGLFESTSELEKFITEVNYPEYRRSKFLDYLRRATYDSTYFRYTFSLSEEELESMPYEFANAWATTPDAVKSKIREAKNEWEVTLSEKPPPAGRPELNDHILPDIFEVNEGIIEISISPQQTEFWRFGLKFSETKDFPITADPRHSQSHPDITVAVGKFEGDRWDEKGLVKLEHPNFPHPQMNYFNQDFTYTGNMVKLIIHLTRHPSNYMTIELIDGDVSRGSHGHELNKMNYFRLSAWCDKIPFSLKIKIVKRMRVDGQIVDAKGLAVKQGYPKKG